MSFPDHFSSVAREYAAFRPTYPDRLFAYLASTVAARRLAWDAGTGNGQAAVPLAEHFTAVIATDASADQLEQAPRDPRITWRVAPAEASGLADRSVDLVTVAQALHWFDQEKFFAEARRVLAPGGAIAVWGYGRPEVSDPALDRVIGRFHHDVVGPFWPPQRTIVEDGYRSISFPFIELDPPRFELTDAWTADRFLGYVATWSATRRAREAGEDPLPAFAEAVREHWPAGDVRPVRWPLHLRVGRPG